MCTILCKGCCSSTTMKDPIQKETLQNTFVINEKDSTTGPIRLSLFLCTVVRTIGTSLQNHRQGATNFLLCRVAIIKLQMFKGCWRENYREYSSEISYLHVSGCAQVKYKKKIAFSRNKWRCVIFQCLSKAYMQILSPSNNIKTRRN